ncbi:MAG: hypothetical protein P8Z30_10935 [Acidobacteriota bacterium]
MMKKFWRWLMVLLVGAGVAFGPGASTCWARPNPPFEGHGHHRDKEKKDHDRGHGRHEHWDHGRHRGWERDRRGRYRFDEVDRRELVRYYRAHRHERWFRRPVPRGLALGYGRVLGPRYRRYCRPLPVVMLRVLPPPPPRCHYFLFGGNVVLVDSGYRVQDFIQLNFNIGG